MTADREPTGSPVTAVRRSSRGPSAGSVLLLVVGAVVGAILVAALSGPNPSPATPVMGASVSPSAPAEGDLAAQPSQPPPPSPVHPVATVIVARGGADPADELGVLTGCQRLRRVTGQPWPRVPGANVDAVAEATGRDTGWLFVPPGIQAATKVWLGGDVVELARAAGQQVVAIGSAGDVWLGGAAGGTRWQPIATPAGRTAWLMTSDQVVGDGACGPWSLLSQVPDQRSVTCAGIDVLTCLALVMPARLAPLALLVPGADLVVAVSPCIDSHRCLAAPFMLVSVPPGWSGALAELRGATPSAPGRPLAPLAPSALPDYALDAVALPSLPLPTRARVASDAACAQDISGTLHASPWDPRVAWVGSEPVVWPADSTIRFVGTAELTVPARPGTTTATAGDRVRVVGAPGPGGRSFAACALEVQAPAEAPAVTPGPLAARGTGS